MFVYFMESNNHIKIGITNNLYTRTKQVQTGCPVKIYLVSYIEVIDRETALKIEKHLHDKLKHLNTYGEWFYTYKQNTMGIVHSEISKFNFSVEDIKTHLDLSDNKKNEISESIFKSIESLRDENIAYHKKIEALNRYLVRLNSNNDDIYITYKKEFMIHYCNKEISRYINLIRKSEKEIENDISNQLKINFTNSYVEEQKIIKKRRDEKFIEISNKKEKEKVEMCKKKIIADKNKIKKVMNKYSFLFSKVK